MDTLKAAQEFAKNNIAAGKKSKLQPHFEAIKYLLEQNFTMLQIQQFLKNDLNLSVSYSNLQGWIKRNFSEIKKVEDIKIEKKEVFEIEKKLEKELTSIEKMAILKSQRE